MSDPIIRLNLALEGRYRIERELGKGGMATVYLADDLRHERKVALKVLKPELAAVVGAQRFLAEIKTTANLQHPHILPLFDSGEADSFLFYVMPYVEGETLRDRLEREKQLPVDEAVRIATDIAEALQCAHEQGVIHRDVKPANVLLSKGRPLVADFGIALAVAQAGGGRLTETGLSMGTPFYMSPEQASADREPGPASDVYSLGCVLYEMLVGEPPYVGGSAQAVLAKILTEHARAPTAVRPSIPAHVDAAIRKALEKLPADRFTHAQDFAKALADTGFRHGEAAGVGLAPGPWKRLSVGLAVASVGLAGALGWSLLRPTERPVSRYVIELPVTQGLFDFGSNIALSPDGAQMVYVGPGQGGPQLWHRRRDQLRAAPLAGTEGALNPVFSPDGQRVAFESATDWSISVISLGGEPPLTISVDPRGVWGLAWSSDDYIWGAVPEGLGRMPATGGAMEVMTTLDTLRSETGHGWPQVLPDGRHVLFVVAHQPQSDASLYEIAVADLETGTHEMLVPGMFARYAASGHLVFVTQEGTLMAAPFDVDAMTIGDPVALAQGVGVRSGGSVHFALSEEGTFVYQAGPALILGNNFEFAWVTRSGLAEPVQPGWSLDPGDLALGFEGGVSPDGSRLVFTQVVRGNQDIWTKVLPDGPESRLTFDEAPDRNPRWSPDGQTVVFESHRGESGTRRLWFRRADGTGDAEVLFDDDRVAMGFWSPDGVWLMLQRGGLGYAPGDFDILAIRPGVDSAAVPLIADKRFFEADPAISPDGRWLAYTSDESGRSEVYVRPFPDVNSDKVQVSTSGGWGSFWAHSGRELFFMDYNVAIVAASVETGGAKFRVIGRETLFTLEGAWAPFGITPDDQRFLMLRPYGSNAEVPREVVLVENFFEELKQRVRN